ncbi:DUF2971 domain-containing protein [Dryocola clanedunensis]
MFKYFPPERIDVLERNLICFSKPDHLNDPYELSATYNLDPFMDELTNNLSTVNLIDHLTPEFKGLLSLLKESEQAKIIAQSQFILPQLLKVNKEFILQFTQSKFDDIKSEICKSIRILCLTEKPDNLLMWTHYADSHKGFVIEFDTQSSFFNQRRSDKDEFGYLRKVKYVEKIPELAPLTSKSIEYWTTKSVEWKYEHEWRMFLTEGTASTSITKQDIKYDLYTLPSEAILSIIIGSKSTSKFENEMKNILQKNLRYKHIAVKKARKSNENFQVIIDHL